MNQSPNSPIARRTTRPRAFSLIAALLLSALLLSLPERARAAAPQMFGVNLAGGEFGPTPGNYGYDYVYPSAVEFDYYNGKGLTFIRVPFKWERVQRALYATLDATEMGRLDAVVAMAHARGMKVLLDMHNYDYYNISGTGYTVGSPQVPVAAFQNVWGQIAAHYANETALYGYDLMNEPQDSLAGWQAAAQGAVNTIRQYDTTNYVFVEGVNWSGSQSWAGSNSTLNVTDSANKLVYSAHSYWNNNHDGTYGADEVGNSNTGISYAQPFVDWIRAHGYNGHIGEYGVPNNSNNNLASWETALDGFLAYLRANNISGTYWTGGPWWGTYPLSCEPTNNWTTDALQMAVLQKYNNFGNPLGTITRDVWTNIAGAAVANIPLTMTPTFTDSLTSFAGPTNWADNYGTRVRGYITAPVTGNYTFWICSDDASELWLSPDTRPANLQRIARVDSWTNPYEWTREANQKSPAISLQAGQRYYVTALQKEGGVGDNLIVAWAKPGESAAGPSEVIPGSVLSPGEVFSTAEGTLIREVWTNVGGTSVTNIPLATTPNLTERLTSFECPTDWADNYGTRVRGVFTAPATGSYTFWIASDDSSELWLSSDSTATNRQRIAWLSSWTYSREWTREANQKSAAVNLVQGQRYYIEALQKEGVGGDNLAVGWARPGQSTAAPSEIMPGTVFTPATGAINRDVWLNVAGSNVANIPLASPPTFSDLLTSFAAPTNWAENYGTRVRGYITAPTTGSYTFWICSDDNSELWLSTDMNSNNMQRIARVDGWTNAYEWTREANQKSAPINLVAGQRYYVTALQKEGGGGDNLIVAWAKPGESISGPSEVVPGSVLSPVLLSPDN